MQGLMSSTFNQATVILGQAIVWAHERYQNDQDFRRFVDEHCMTYSLLAHPLENMNVFTDAMLKNANVEAFKIYQKTFLASVLLALWAGVYYKDDWISKAAPFLVFSFTASLFFFLWDDEEALSFFTDQCTKVCAFYLGINEKKESDSDCKECGETSKAEETIGN